MSKYQVDVPDGQVGVIGDGAQVGEIHFHAPPTPIPLQRPTEAEHFTGREHELTQLLADLQPGRVVTLCGPGGIGKTALAAKAVWTLAPGDKPPERFPDGIIFHSFYGRPDVALAFEHIVHSFDHTARDASAGAAHRLLANKRALLILDGTEQAGDLPAVLEARGACGVLVTSRKRKDAVSHAERQDIAPLPTDEAVQLLQAWGKDWAADVAAVRQICELVGGLPLAVRLVGRYLAETGETAAEYLAWLEEAPFEALDPDEAQHRLESVPWLLERSLAQVSPQAREVLALAGQLALAPFGPAVVAEALRLPTGALKRALRQLTGYGLLQRSGDRYTVSHALIHTYARRRMTVPDEAAERLVAYYTQLAETESEKELAGYAVLDAERPHLMRVLAVCVEGERWQAARSLVWAIGDRDGYLDMQGHWTEWGTALEAGITAARQSNNRYEEGVFLRLLGNAYYYLGQVEKAIEYHTQALQIAREIGDRRSEGNRLGNLGTAYYSLGQVEQAIEYHQQALVVSHEIGDRRGEGAHLGNLGLAYAALGQVEQAIEYFTQALAISREIGDRRGEGTGLGNLGIAYVALGQMERAIEYHTQALAISREIGDRQGEESELGSLGNAYRNLGQMEQAIEYHTQALDIAREIGDRRGEGNDLGNLGNAYYSLGQVEQAIEYSTQALDIAREIGNRWGEGNCLGNLGLAYAALGQVEKAIEYYSQALDIAHEIGDRRGEGVHLHNIGELHKDQGNIPLARQYLQQALTIFEEIKSPYAQESHRLLAELD